MCKLSQLKCILFVERSFKKMKKNIVGKKTCEKLKNLKIKIRK